MQKSLPVIAIAIALFLALPFLAYASIVAPGEPFFFSYTFATGKTVSGTVEGDLQPDGNAVSNLRNLVAQYSGDPTQTFSFVSQFARFLDLSGIESPSPACSIIPGCQALGIQFSGFVNDPRTPEFQPNFGFAISDITSLPFGFGPLKGVEVGTFVTSRNGEGSPGLNLSPPNIKELETFSVSHWSARAVGGPAPVPHQILYLNFDPASNISFQGSTINASGFSLPLPVKLNPFLDRQRIIDKIAQEVRDEFKPYLIDVTTQKPLTSSETSTVYFAEQSEIEKTFWGRLFCKAPLPASISPCNLGGIADDLDFRNHQSHHDNALIFPTNFSFNPSASEDDIANDIARTVLHETGHILGLIHLEDSSKFIMGTGQTNGGTRIFSGPTGARVLNEPGVPPGITTQNDRYELLQALGGTLNPSFYGSPTDLDDYILKKGIASINLSVTQSIYNVHLAIAREDIAHGAMPNDLISPQSIAVGTSLEFSSDLLPGDHLLFAASSIPGGNPDIFALTSTSGFNFQKPDFEDLLIRSGSLQNNSVAGIQVYMFEPTGDIHAIGTISLTSVPEPSSGILIGTVVLVFIIVGIVRRKGSCSGPESTLSNKPYEESISTYST